MNDRQIIDSLAAAVEKTTPDVFDDILARCERLDRSRQKRYNNDIENIFGADPAAIAAADNFSREKPARRVKSTWIKRITSIAAALVIGCGAWLGYGYYSVDSVIGFDVNPSIELNINRTEKVLSAVPLNADAETILDGMNLKSVDLDIAVNALIGSMLKQGYVSEIKNSILISVENNDSEKGAVLQKRLSDEVDSLLTAYSVGGAVLSQTVSEDERLKTLASENGISLGKATLVDLLVSKDARLQFADIAKLPINDINLLLADRQSDMQGVSSVGQASAGVYIGEEKAKSVAMNDAGIAEASATFIKVKLDFDDGRMVYEVDFYSADSEYEYEIDASGGQIVSRDVDRERFPASTGASPGDASGGNSGNNTSNIASSGNTVSEAKAKSTALNHAGLSESAVSRLNVKLDRDDGRNVYEVEFRQGNIEYDYEIDAETGNITEWDSDYDD